MTINNFEFNLESISSFPQQLQDVNKITYKVSNWDSRPKQTVGQISCQLLKYTYGKKMYQAKQHLKSYKTTFDAEKTCLIQHCPNDALGSRNIL